MKLIKKSDFLFKKHTTFYPFKIFYAEFVRGHIFLRNEKQKWQNSHSHANDFEAFAAECIQKSPPLQLWQLSTTTLHDSRA